MREFSLLVFLPEASSTPYRELGYEEAAEVVSGCSVTLACFVCGRELPVRQLYTITSILRRYLVPLCSEDADRAITKLGDWCSPLDVVVREALRRYDRPFVQQPGFHRPIVHTFKGFPIADTAAAVKLLRLRFALEPSND